MRTEWEQAATAGTYTPLPDERLDEMFEYTARYGSGNGWTGNNAATFIRELLRERAHLIRELNLTRGNS